MKLLQYTFSGIMGLKSALSYYFRLLYLVFVTSSYFCFILVGIYSFLHREINILKK